MSCTYMMRWYAMKKTENWYSRQWNRIILEHGVKTTAKVTTAKKETPTSETNLDSRQERIVVDAVIEFDKNKTLSIVSNV